MDLFSIFYIALIDCFFNLLSIVNADCHFFRSGFCSQFSLFLIGFSQVSGRFTSSFRFYAFLITFCNFYSVLFLLFLASVLIDSAFPHIGSLNLCFTSCTFSVFNFQVSFFIFQFSIFLFLVFSFHLFFPFSKFAFLISNFYSTFFI